MHGDLLMGRRTLALRREPLAELTTGELAGLVGAAVPPPTPVVHTLPIKYCLPSIDCPPTT